MTIEKRIKELYPEADPTYNVDTEKSLVFLPNQKGIINKRTFKKDILSDLEHIGLRHKVRNFQVLKI